MLLKISLGLLALPGANALSRRPLASTLNAEGRLQDVQEYMCAPLPTVLGRPPPPKSDLRRYPRDWIFTQEFNKAGKEPWRRNGKAIISQA